MPKLFRFLNPTCFSLPLLSFLFCSLCWHLLKEKKDMAKCLKRSFRCLKERNTSLPRNFSIANAKWNCRVVYTRIWKSECFQLVERKGLTVLEVQLTKNFIHALLVMVVLPGPKIIKLKTQIHNGSLEPLCFPTQLSPALLH